MRNERKMGKKGARLTIRVMGIVALVLLLCSLLLAFLLFEIKDNLSSIDELLITSIADNNDANLLEMQLYAASLDTSMMNLELKMLDAPFDDIPSYCYQMSDYMRSYGVANNLIDRIFIYYSNLDLVVGSYGVFKAGSYYKLMNGLQAEGSSYFYEAINSASHGFHLLPLDGDKDFFALVRPLLFKEERVGSIVIEIDRAALVHPVEASFLDGSSILYTIKSGDDVVAGIGDWSLLGSSNSLSMPSEFSNLEFVVNLGGLSSLEFLKLLILISMSAVVVSICVGLFLSLRVGRKSTEPIENLFFKLGLEADDEFWRAEERVSRMLKDMEDSLEKISGQQKLIASLFLQDVIKGKFSSDEEIMHHADECSILIDQGFFFLVASKQEYDEYFRNICEDVITTEIEESLFISMFLSYDADDSQIAADQLKALSADKGISLGLSLTYDELVKIPIACRQALSALAQGNEGALFEYDGSPVANDGAELFLAELRMGRFDNASRLIDTLFSSIFNHGENENMRKIKFSGFASELESVFGEVQLSYVDEAVLHRSLENVLSIKVGEKVDESSICQRAKALIEENYKDNQFGLFKLSEMLGVNNSYLSSRFKAEYGIGVAQVISHLRIREAKHLILTSDLRIKDIAESVGFTSDIAFIRAFKRIEDQTPSALRR